MLAEQLGNLQEAEGHYEQHLALASTQQAQDTHGPEWVSAYANVMKVSLDSTSYSCNIILSGSLACLQTVTDYWYCVHRMICAGTMLTHAQAVRQSVVIERKQAAG